ncbi:hypothetical protein BSKO_07836 [Bryopsis sp. KO-2023]|nr:hypothetical protein BSKO_07836 [Bryopsis sp. KO-2023]
MLNLVRHRMGQKCEFPDIPSVSHFRDPGNEPWMRWWFDFLRPVSKKPFACLWLSRCKTLDDPMDFICIQGAKDDVKVLRRLARRALKEAV